MAENGSPASEAPHFPPGNGLPPYSVEGTGKPLKCGFGRSELQWLTYAPLTKPDIVMPLDACTNLIQYIIDQTNPSHKRSHTHSDLDPRDNSLDTRSTNT